MVRTSLGYLQVNGNLVINGCVRDLKDFENLNVAISEPSPDLKGISVDIRGPGGELLNPVKQERGKPKDSYVFIRDRFQTRLIGSVGNQ